MNLNGLEWTWMDLDGGSPEICWHTKYIHYNILQQQSPLMHLQLIQHPIMTHPRQVPVS